MSNLKRRRKSIDLIYYYEDLSSGDVSVDETFIEDGTNTNINRKIGLCGTLPFCDQSAKFLCQNISINECPECSLAKAGSFVFFLVFLGLAIFLGNMLIIIVGYLRYRKKKMEKMDILKISLALADLLTGIQLLILIPYNFGWTINLTFKELKNQSFLLRGTALPNFGLVFVTFGYTSSVYHLMYIGMQRLYAIIKPLAYRVQEKQTIIFGLVIVWILSLISATTSLWFPNHLTGGYLIPLMSYVPVVRNIGSDDFTALYWTLGVFWLLPFLIMTCLTFGVGIAVLLKLKVKLEIKDHELKAKKMERKVFATVAIMQLGFTVTLIPLVVVLLLFYRKWLDCRNITLPYVITFYLSMANSLVNVIVYNIREKKFRSSIAEAFTSFASVIHLTSTSSTNQ